MKEKYITIFKTYKEVILYLFFGGLTFLLSISTFWFFTVPLSMNALLANIIVWIICVLFAYYTNRNWVFEDKAHDRKGIIREWTSFTGGRIFTLVLEELILWIGIDILSINSMVVKIAAQVFVVIGNYVISKWIVFKG